MKTYILTFTLLIGCLLSKNVSSQVQVSLNVNVGTQPNWGPTGYDHVEYYYIPDIDVYYYVPRHQFVYISNGQWIFAASLPSRCRSYDLYRGYKVVINEPEPYRHCDVHRKKYGKYKGWYGKQVVIRDSPHHEEIENDDHPGNHGKGHAYGHDKHKKDD